MESVSDLVDSLESALREAVLRCANDSGNLGVLFSGGLDSSLLVKFCEELDLDVKLYSVAMESSHDYKHLEESASFFDYDFSLKIIENNEIVDYARKVIAAVKSRRPLDVSIGIPLYAACETAQMGGCDTVLVGQGADELFAGYHRYLEMTENELQKALEEDLQKLIKKDINRDIAIAEANSLRLCAPYIDDDFVTLARAVPVGLKIKDGVRKFVLRELARNMKMPKVLYERDKKAVQYSSGVDKALRKLAKKEKENLGVFLSGI